MFRALADGLDGLKGKMFGGGDSGDNNHQHDTAADPFGQVGMEREASHEDVFAHAQALREQQVEKTITGTGYSLGFAHHKHPEAHVKPYIFQSPLGAPFPSYHDNPMPDFPARWTQIADVSDPIETLTAPRIRLGPRELKGRREELESLRVTAEAEAAQPVIETLNLGYQCLGDPYQYEAFVTFMDLNRNVRILNLTDNQLEDLTDLHLDAVVRLHLGNNNFTTFEALPPLPNCEELFLTENFISGLNGIDKKNFPRLRILNIQHNPVALMTGYRRKLKTDIPTLEWVDGMNVRDMDTGFLANLMAGDD